MSGAATVTEPSFDLGFSTECLAAPGERCSVYKDWELEALKFKWIESEKVGYDLGEDAIQTWVHSHWHGYLRAKWLEHLEGTKFWVELDRGDYGLLRREFQNHAVLLDRILDRLKVGQENLHILCWADIWNIPFDQVVRILEMLDINSRRLEHQLERLACGI